jgi:hypothetical protein
MNEGCRCLQVRKGTSPWPCKIIKENPRYQRLSLTSCGEGGSQVTNQIIWLTQQEGLWASPALSLTLRHEEEGWSLRMAGLARVRSKADFTHLIPMG